MDKAEQLARKISRMVAGKPMLKKKVRSKLQVWKRIGDMTWDLPDKSRPESTINPIKRVSIAPINGIWNVYTVSREKKTYKETSKDFKIKSQALAYAKQYMRKN